jgi:hypothetical protein
MTLVVQKTQRSRSKKKPAKARKSKIRDLRARALVGDVYRNGKRVTSGVTLFELLASRKRAAK